LYIFFQDDFTVVSGDSRGKTSFWKGRTGTLVDSYQSHKADVLAVAISPDQQVQILKYQIIEVLYTISNIS